MAYLNTCTKHPAKPVVYDGKVCPACQAIAEFLRLTDELYYVNLERQLTRELTRKGRREYDSRAGR
jgi:predicted DCC family thiol-disulfide oxidoreductase YuxK